MPKSGVPTRADLDRLRAEYLRLQQEVDELLRRSRQLALKFRQFGKRPVARSAWPRPRSDRSERSDESDRADTSEAIVSRGRRR
jgi:hypothetical protein